jgi:hypothetical protein
MHLKVFLKLKKTLKPSLLGNKTQKNAKKRKKNAKKPKKRKKKTTGLGFFLKNPGFFQPWVLRIHNNGWIP